MMRAVCGGVVLSLVLVVAGCSSSKEPSETSTKSDTGDGAASSPAASEAESAAFIAREIPKRPSLEGRWIVLFYLPSSGAEMPAALVDIAKSGKESKLQLSLRQFGLTFNNSKLKKADVTDKSVHMLVDLSLQSQDPQKGTARATVAADILVDFKDGIARGNAQINPAVVFPVLMVPSDLEILQETRPQPLREADELKGLEKDAFFTKTESFFKAHPESTIAFDIYPALFQNAPQQKLDSATVAAAADKYAALSARWGSRMELRAHVNVADALASRRYLPQVAIRHLDAALGMLNEETTPIWKPTLLNVKESAVAMRALEIVKDGPASEKPAAVETLRKRNATQPYDPTVLFALAHYDEESGKKDSALRGYAELAVLPMLDRFLSETAKQEKVERPSSRESAARLWKETHGKDDGLEKYLDDVYAQSMPKFEGKPVSPRAQNPENRVVLCELFTGAACPVCVAADVAFAHAIKTYAPTELIAIQYHLHVPDSDPLANEDAESRFAFYGLKGCPSISINGNVAQGRGIGGLLQQSSVVYLGIRGAIDQILATTKTPVKIRLGVEPKGNAFAVTAEADGAVPAGDPVRLRLVLAEELVALRGSNGIRQHEMVVRSMPGGAMGVEPKEGKFRFQGTVDLKAIRQQLDDYLSAHEQARRTTFPVKPMDLTRLHLVAFVQNDKTREVYQSATVPLSATASTANEKKPQSSAITGDATKASASVRPTAPK